MTNPFLRILVIEDNPDDVVLLNHLLTASPLPKFELVHFDRVREGLNYLGEFSSGIDIILLDLNLPDSQGLDTFLKFFPQFPNIPILVLSGLDDESLAIEAVRKGAQDYLVKGQIKELQLDRAIRHAIERQKSLRRQLQEAKIDKSGKVIAFMGAKGGVGTTSVALNVASCLARDNHNVIAVELRGSYGTFSLVMGQKPINNLSSLLKLQEDCITENNINELLYNSNFGLKLLFGPQGANELNDIPPDHALSIIKTISLMGDYIIVDLPFGNYTASKAISRNCHQIVMVVERDTNSVLSGRITLDLLNSWGVSPTLIGVVVVTRIVLPAGMTSDDIKSHLDSDIIGIVPYSAEVVLKSQVAGQPIVVCEPHNIASQSLRDIANKLA